MKDVPNLTKKKKVDVAVIQKKTRAEHFAFPLRFVVGLNVKNNRQIGFDFRYRLRMLVFPTARKEFKLFVAFLGILSFYRSVVELSRSGDMQYNIYSVSYEPLLL